MTALAALQYLGWSEWPITFDRTNHPNLVVEVGRFPLVISVVIETMRMTKILMDGGSGINILYKDAFNRPNMDIRKLHMSESPFHSIVPGRCVVPLAQ